VIVALLLGSNLPNPLFPLYARAYALSPLDITFVFATYTLLVIPALLLFAPFSDSRGRRETLQPAIVVAAVAAGLFAATTSVVWLFVAQAVQAVALGALQGTAAPTLVETDPNEDVRRAAAIASAATLGGAAAGPILAGVLAQYAPLSPRLPYLVEVGLLAVALVVVTRVVPRRRDREPWRPRRPTVPREIRARFTAASIAAFVGWAVTGLFLALVPSFVADELGQRNLVVSGVVMAVMLAASAVAAYAAPSSAATIGIVLMLAGVGGLFAVTELKTLAGLVAVSVVAGVGQGLTFQGALADVNEIAPEERKADVVAALYVVVYLATALPVIGVGALASPLGLVRAIEVFAAVVAGVCVLGLVLLRSRA
jgi:MFS family permease